MRAMQSSQVSFESLNSADQTFVNIKINYLSEVLLSFMVRLFCFTGLTVGLHRQKVTLWSAWTHSHSFSPGCVVTKRIPPSDFLPVWLPPEQCLHGLPLTSPPLLLGCSKSCHEANLSPYTRTQCQGWVRLWPTESKLQRLPAVLHGVLVRSALRRSSCYTDLQVILVPNWAHVELTGENDFKVEMLPVPVKAGGWAGSLF